MKVIETIEYCSDDHSDPSGINVQIITDDGVTGSVGFREGEPEDMSLHRDLSDAHHISGLIKMAYDAGKRGEEWEYESVEEHND